MNDAFDRLKMDFPLFEVRNTKSYAQHIPLAGGDSVQVNAHATVRINSHQLIQLPDFTSFKMVSPSMQDLIAYKLVGGSSEAEPAPQPVEENPLPPPPYEPLNEEAKPDKANALVQNPPLPGDEKIASGGKSFGKGR